MSVRRWVLVVLVVLTGGAAGAVAGGWWGWRSPAPMPADHELAQIAGPGSTVTSRVDGVFGWDPAIADWRDSVVIWTTGDDGYEAGQVELTRTVPDAPTALTAASAGLAATGWQTHAISSDEYGRRFWALRDGITVQAEIDNDTDNDEGTVVAGHYAPQVHYTFRRSAPAAVRWATPLGWLLGALAALALAVLLVRRRPAPILAWAGLGALVPATLLTTLGVVPIAFPALDNEREIPSPPWFAFTMFGVHPLALAGVLLLLAAAASRLARGVRSSP